jgi:hypothetical protein
MNVTYRGQVYTVRTDAELLALVTWLSRVAA